LMSDLQLDTLEQFYIRTQAVKSFIFSPLTNES